CNQRPRRRRASFQSYACAVWDCFAGRSPGRRAAPPRESEWEKAWKKALNQRFFAVTAEGERHLRQRGSFVAKTLRADGEIRAQGEPEAPLKIARDSSRGLNHGQGPIDQSASPRRGDRFRRRPRVR